MHLITCECIPAFGKSNTKHVTFLHTFNAESIGVFDTLLILFRSPHLLEVRERIRLNGRPLSKSKFVTYFWECYKMLDATKASGGNVVTVSVVYKFIVHLSFSP